MIKRIQGDERYFTNIGWLKTYWLFSFSDYYDPRNISHGGLRVFNDDIIQPQNGFPDHPHNNYEIITIILDGELTHWDSAGNKGVIRAGDVQRMTAGSGVFHSEFNYGIAPVHLYQIWIRPKEDDLPPSYEQRHFDLYEKNKLTRLASPEGKGCLLINSNSFLYSGCYEQDQKLIYTSEPERKVFIYMTSGEIRLNNECIKRNDQARIEGESSLQVNICESSKFIIIDVPAF